MLNTRKLLYILPDVAYVAELLPTKKEHTFAIQSFRQINGEFLNEEDDLIPENIEKLFSKIEPETYHVVLPDFLFTNTILEIKETQESKVKQHIKDTLLPDLGLSKDSHEIETFILTQYGNATKIQLTALEKDVVAPIAQSAANHKVTVDRISPLSWTIKSVISLEPSISIIQIGSMLYTAEHYIGVDQCTMANIEEIENVGDTIKTLKGAQPSIQTIYLMTNALVEEKLKDLVSSTVPIQQLATFKDDESQMPSYVKQIIESGMKTMDISDYPVPAFDLPKVTANKVVAATEEVEAEITEPVGPVEKPRPLDVFEDEPDDKPETELEAEELPAPIVPVVPAELPKPMVAEELAELSDDSDSDEADTDEVVLTEEVVESELVSELDPKFTSELEEHEPDLAVSESVKSEVMAAELEPPKAAISLSDEIPDKPPAPPAKPPVIKNKANTAWGKMLFTFLSVFLVTVMVGAGLTYGVLRLTGQLESDEVAVSPSPSPTAEPSPIPSPSPSPTIERGELAILVVNATTKAGYAGTTRSRLEAAGYETVRAANARGEYEPGMYVLMNEQNAALISALSSDSELSLVFAPGYSTEDPRSEYDAVIVLAE